MDKVSIVMPNYNCGKFIKETIESVINQTYSNWEILFVDDCSTDNSLEIAKSFNDERIKIFKNEKNSGAAFSRNKALREASGKWIAFLDSDDIWAKDKLEKQVAFMKKNGYVFSYTQYNEINSNSEEIGKYVTGPKSISKRRFFNYCWVGCLTVMYNRDIVGLIQINNAIAKRNDYALWLKVCKKAKCYLLPKILASYRRREGSISHHKKTKLIKHHYRLFRIGEGNNPLLALWRTFKNLFYGVIKKTFYVKKENLSEIKSGN